jgi:hypothetical protein
VNINPEDLVIVSDAGVAYVVRFNAASPEAPQVATIEVIADASIAEAALNTANEGVLVANLPQDALGGGCTCFLLNLRGLSRPAARAVSESPASGKRVQSA